MIITAIERQRKNENRYSIFIDGEFSFGLSGTDVLFYKLKEGSEIDEKTRDYLINEVEFIKARDCAVRYIGYRMRSRQEVINKLKSAGYSDNVTAKVIELIARYDYLDDVKYCTAYINEKMKLKGFGKVRIAYELQQRGVSKEDIDSAYYLIEKKLDESSGMSLKEAELEQAVNALRKKYGGSIDEPKQKSKAYNFLARRGFSDSIIRECLKIYEKTVDSHMTI